MNISPDMGSGTVPQAALSEIRGHARRAHLPRSHPSDDHAGLLIARAPKGSGKTSLLSHYAATTDRPLAWVRSRPSMSPSELAGLVLAGIGLPRDRSADITAQALLDLVRAETQPCLIVIDDADVLPRQTVDTMVRPLAQRASPNLAIVLGTSRHVDVGIAELRTRGLVTELGPSELALRPWDVELLTHRRGLPPMAPSECRSLTARTNGWLAPILLFLETTRGQPPSARSTMLRQFDGRTRAVADYLDDTVLAGLTAQERDFLTETSALESFGQRASSRLLSETDPAEIASHLRSLESQAVLTRADHRPDALALNPLVRTRLESDLGRRLGANAISARRSRAAGILMETGNPKAAVRASLAAGDGDLLRKLHAREPQSFVHALAEMADTPDPQRAPGDLSGVFEQARRLRRLRDGDLGGAQPDAATIDRSGDPVEVWNEPLPPTDTTPSGLLREATRCRPGQVASHLRQSGDDLALVGAGLADLLDGNLMSADQMLAGCDCSDEPALRPVVLLGRILAQVPPGAHDVRYPVTSLVLVAEEALRSDVPSLGRAAIALHAHVTRDESAFDDLVAGFAAQRNTWAVATLKFFAGTLDVLGANVDERTLHRLDEATPAFRLLGAGVLETWARAVGSLASNALGLPAEETIRRATKAARLATVIGLPLAERCADLASGLATGDSQLVAECLGALDGAGIAMDVTGAGIHGGAGTPARKSGPGRTAASTGPSGSVDAERASGPRSREELAPSLEITCFGRFSMSIGGDAVPLEDLKPKARSTLRLLALHAGQALHREQLIEAIWPDVDPTAGTRNLQVAISSIRRALEPEADRGESSWLQRSGDAYLLRIPDDAEVDVLEFRAAMVGARTGDRRGDRDSAQALYRRALDLHSGDLLPEDGPAEWVVPEREWFRSEASTAATELARMDLPENPTRAMEACEQGLRIDRYRDELWKLLIESAQASGNVAAAARARSQYEAILVDLGVRAPNRRAT